MYLGKIMISLLRGLTEAEPIRSKSVGGLQRIAGHLYMSISKMVMVHGKVWGRGYECAYVRDLFNISPISCPLIMAARADFTG